MVLAEEKEENKITKLIMALLAFFLMMGLAYAIELNGGVDASAQNGAIAGCFTPESNTIVAGGNAHTEEATPGIDVTVDALVGNDMGIGKVTASKTSHWSTENWRRYNPIPTPGPKDPFKSYILKSDKLTKTNVPWYVISSSGLVSQQDMMSSISNAANVWNTETGHNFYSTAVQIAPSGTKAIANDGKFVQSWGPFSDDTYIAFCWTRTSLSSVVDSDIQYNTHRKFTMDKTLATKDLVWFPFVSIHEMGHPLGLEDIYDDASKNWDMREVMNEWGGVVRVHLGPGDKAGIMKKYG